MVPDSLYDYIDNVGRVAKVLANALVAQHGSPVEATKAVVYHMGEAMRDDDALAAATYQRVLAILTD